ncbi:hypothetical protein BKA60DRAFT_596636 [Fusarium oxysporum]|nr:hypothetical protein BKA60DRAFT_596636 [Fusarium oxysporum]
MKSFFLFTTALLSSSVLAQSYSQAGGQGGGSVLPQCAAPGSTSVAPVVPVPPVVPTAPPVATPTAPAPIPSTPASIPSTPVPTAGANSLNTGVAAIGMFPFALPRGHRGIHDNHLLALVRLQSRACVAQARYCSYESSALLSSFHLTLHFIPMTDILFTATHPASLLNLVAVMAHAEEAAASPAQPSPTPAATPAADLEEIVMPPNFTHNPKEIQSVRRYVRRIEAVIGQKPWECRNLLGDLANLLEEAIKVCDASAIKDHLHERANPPRGGQHKVLRAGDIKAAREFFGATKGANLTRSASKPTAQREDDREIGAMDDDDDTMADEHSRRGGLTSILASINSRKLSDAALEHGATADSIVAANHNENTIALAESTSPEEAPATPSPLPYPPTNKRDRCNSSTSANPSNKRVCNEAASSLQPLQPTAPPPPMMTDQHNSDDHSALIQATDAFHHHLEMHVQDLRKQHEQRLGIVELQQHHINHELEIHQPSLEAYRIAQEYSLQAEAKVENLRADNEKLNTLLKSLADSKDLWMAFSAEKFEAMEQDLVAQLAAKVSALEEAEAELGAAQLTCHQTEEAARPALEFMNKETPQLEEKKTTAERLSVYVTYTEFLQLLVRTSPSAIATLDKLLQEKGSSLQELRAVIEQHGQLAQVDGQQADVPMA